MKYQEEFNQAVRDCLGDRGNLLGNVSPSPYDLFCVIAVVHEYAFGSMVLAEFSIVEEGNKKILKRFKMY